MVNSCSIALGLILWVTLFAAPLSAASPAPLRLKTAQLQLRTEELRSAGMRQAQQTFQVAEDYQEGDRWAAGVVGLSVESHSLTPFGQGLSWEVRTSESQRQLVLERLGSWGHIQMIVKVSVLIVGKELDERVILLQNVAISHRSNVRHLENGVLLTASQSLQLSSATPSSNSPTQIAILHRGFKMAEEIIEPLIALDGYYLNDRHIHIHAQLQGVLKCFLTLLIVHRPQLALLRFEIFQLSQDPLFSGPLIGAQEKIQFAKCSNSLRNSQQKQCWEMKKSDLGLGFRKIENKTTKGVSIWEEVLEDVVKDEGFELHGRMLSGCKPSTCPCPPTFLHAVTCFEDNACKCKILTCAAGYYTTATLVNSCTACPTNLTHCTNCALQFGTTNVTCTACSPGYTVLNKVCVACPVGCATCTTVLVNKVATVTCLTCLATFTLQTSGSVKVCGCASNQFLNTGVSPIACTNCPTSCLTCTSLAVCSVCSVGYYLSGSSCPACMPVCKTCSSSGSCLSCFSSATGALCTCPVGTLYDPLTKSCLSCTTIQPNCATCDYSGGFFDPTSPTPVICLLANPGYYLTGSSSAAACMSYCTNCDTSPLVCDVPATNFMFDGTSCVCNGGLYFSVAQSDCLLCGAAVPGCAICATLPIPSATLCSTCDTGFFPATAVPTLTCTACNSLCTTCSSATVCLTCIHDLTIISNMCGCNSGASLFLDPVTLYCTSCSTAIFGCQTCATGASGVTCATPAPGFYVGTGSTVCFPCPATCSACSSGTVCTSCDAGYTLSGGVCQCASACGDCMTNSSNTCSSCTYTPFICTGCAVGYYMSAPSTCLACTVFPHCVDCTSGGCLSCLGPFVLTASGCGCNNTADFYLSVDTTTCQDCQTVIPNCQTCTNTGPTTVTSCQTAMPGFYIDSAQSCLPCTGGCLTCSTSSTHCLSCLVTYVWLSPISCGCDNTANYYYDPATTGCSLCTTIFPNCQTCSSVGLSTTCTLCSGVTYWNAGTLSCEACSPSCTTCSSLSVCTGCPSNLVLSETVLGYTVSGLCVCDNSTLTPSFYDAASGTCEPCSYFYTACTACFVNGSSVFCSSTGGSTYLVNSVAVNCPSPCSTCDSSGCITCPTGMTNVNGTCFCDSACTDCETLSVGCVSCTISAGLLTSCSACLPGTYLSSPDCLSCPATCATCTGLTACLTCQPTYVLIGTMCSCPLTLGIFPDSNALCTPCASIFYACTECQISSGVTVCSACSDGYYLNGGQCSVCNSNCLTCITAATTCTSCAVGETLTAGGVCACSSAACLACSALSPNCATCVYTIYGVFSKCSACDPGFYINGANCSPCPTTCQTCTTGGACLTCPNTFQVVGGNCVCNSLQNMWESASTCLHCATLYPNCQTCTQNALVALNVSCVGCDTNYFPIKP